MARVSISNSISCNHCSLTITRDDKLGIWTLSGSLFDQLYGYCSTCKTQILCSAPHSQQILSKITRGTEKGQILWSLEYINFIIKSQAPKKESYVHLNVSVSRGIISNSFECPSGLQSQIVYQGWSNGLSDIPSKMSRSVPQVQPSRLYVYSWRFALDEAAPSRFKTASLLNIALEGEQLMVTDPTVKFVLYSAMHFSPASVPPSSVTPVS